VKAPLPGLIGAKQVSVGSLVGKGEPTLMATISQLDPIWFYCSISEVDYLTAHRKLQEAGVQLRDLPVTLILSDGTEHPDAGNWVFLDRAVDIATGTIRARAQFPNPKKVLRPGMFARTRLSVKARKENILVPERALVEMQGKAFVWVIGEDNKATQRKVQLSQHKIGENLIVEEGLKAGERIVTEGLQKVREGGLVQPMTAAQLAEAAAQAAMQVEARKEGEAKSTKE
jgi:membrane fusion protein (multidrug efflux system)